jgi:dihydroxyacetone kinase
VKKLINSPRTVVREMLEGLADLHPGLAILESDNVVLRAGLPPPAQRPVALLSGGGSGHEPAHAGYVGQGMLTAAVAGEVFTSPSVDAVLAAIRASAGPAGALLIVKNYTGDRLNFGLAAELARADGIPVEEVIVADDVALRGVVANDRRRGIAGTVLVHKIAGAAAAAGRSLADVARLARAAAGDLGTMGVALGACTVPTAGRPGFELGADEIELGLGIHGEAGVERAAMMPVDALVERLLTAIQADRGLGTGSRVVLLVNGLGGTPPMELAIVARAAVALLRTRGVSVERAWSGTFLSALEMPGVSLSLLPVDDERLALLDAATTAPAWPGPGRLDTRAIVAAPPVPSSRTAKGPADPRLIDGLLAIAAALEAAEDRLADLDGRAGDGDLGASMVRAATALRGLASEPWQARCWPRPVTACAARSAARPARSTPPRCCAPRGVCRRIQRCRTGRRPSPTASPPSASWGAPKRETAPCSMRWCPRRRLYRAPRRCRPPRRRPKPVPRRRRRWRRVSAARAIWASGRWAFPMPARSPSPCGCARSPTGSADDQDRIRSGQKPASTVASSAAPIQPRPATDPPTKITSHHSATPST